MARVFPGSTDKATVEDFIEQLLEPCGPWPAPETVLVMDNATFHYSDKIQHMCDEASVKLIYLYTPTTKIEEFFGELKSNAKSQYNAHRDLMCRDFEAFVKARIKAVGNRHWSSRQGSKGNR